MYLYEYLSLWDIQYIIRNSLISTFQYKFNYKSVQLFIRYQLIKLLYLLMAWYFIVAFIYPTYMWIALIWGFLSQLSLWKSIYYLWRYKLNEVCDTPSLICNLGILFNLMNTHIYLQISFHTWSNLFSIWFIMNICSKQVLSWYYSW